MARWAWSSAETSREPCADASPASSALFPPGPAHRSSHQPARAGTSDSAQATSWLPSSCTPARASRTAGTDPGSPARTAPNGENRVGDPPAATNSATSANPGRTASVVPGTWLSESRAARSSRSGRTCANASTIHSGCAVRNARAARSPSPSHSRSSHSDRSWAAILRTIALTTPVARSPTPALATSTLVDTAACTGTAMASTWWAARRNTSTTAGCRVRNLRPPARSMIAS